DGLQSVPIQWSMSNTKVKRAFINELARLKAVAASRPAVKGVGRVAIPAETGTDRLESGLFAEVAID
ncbi:MAG: hypothetical protein RMJ35_06750, partial [Phycisphaerales bacterium]|nr:hypothetical protein [Phycisphaerales bacterium]